VGEDSGMKSWTEKFDAPASVDIKPGPVSIAGMRAEEIMLVPTPKLIDDFIRAIPEVTQIDVKSMPKASARKDGTDVTCPIHIGYHLTTAAEAAHEMLSRGAALSPITPLWPVLEAKTPTTKRLSFVADFVAEQRPGERLED
jgi:hypothetical protein